MYKPKLTYAEFVAAQKKGLTVAQCIYRFIAEMDCGVRPVGESHRYILQRLARTWLGAKVAAQLTKADFIDYCRERCKSVKPQTTNQDITYLTGVLKYAGSAWADCSEVSAAPIEAAKPFLTKHNLISKAIARERRPTPEEIEALIAYFDKPVFFGKYRVERPRKLNMVLMTLWQWYSARRVGESCSLLWEDWNRDAQTILVRKMKDPRKKNKSKIVALTNQAQQLLIALETIREPAEPRIFPFKAKSVSAAYTLAKKPGAATPEGITDLRLHDSRRDRGTRLVEDDGCTPAEAICYTGHETVAVFERVYLRQDPAKIVAQVNARH